MLLSVYCMFFNPAHQQYQQELNECLPLSPIDCIQYHLMLPLITESSFNFTYTFPAAAAFASQEGISCESIIIFLEKKRK